MKKIIVLLTVVFFSFNIIGCGGLIGGVMPPEPLIKPSDKNLACDSISIELQNLTNKRNNIQRMVTGKRVGNVIMGITGLFLIFPWFMLDFSTDEEIALSSVDNRINYLQTEQIRKDCH